MLSTARQFLAGYKQATAQVYALGIDQWIVFCDHNGLHPFDARRAHFDLWRRHLEQLGKAPATPASLSETSRIQPATPIPEQHLGTTGRGRISTGTPATS